MTKDEVARLRGELFGLQVLVMHCLCFVAANVEHPRRHLQEFRDAAVEGVLQAEAAGISPRYLRQFQNSATSVVCQCMEAAQSVVAQATAPKAPTASAG